MNKKTKALSTEQYKEIIQTLREGCCCLKANERIAMTLIVEAKQSANGVYRNRFVGSFLVRPMKEIYLLQTLVY